MPGSRKGRSYTVNPVTGNRHHKKYPPQMIIAMRADRARGKKIIWISVKYHVPPGYVSQVVNRKIWRNL